MFADFECPECHRVYIDVWIPRRTDSVRCECGAGEMTKRIAAPNFKVNGYNAENGYSDD